MIEIKPDYDNRESFIVLSGSKKMFKSGIREALFEIGMENVKHLRHLLKDRTSKTGRFYFYRRHASHGGGSWWQASAPGEAPAKRTGMLLRTTHYTLRGSDEVEFGDKQIYGKWLELGTKKIKPRPHIRRTAEEKERDNYNSLAHTVYRKISAHASGQRKHGALYRK